MFIALPIEAFYATSRSSRTIVLNAQHSGLQDLSSLLALGTAVVVRRQIPTDISVDDKIAALATIKLVPDTSIDTFIGGDNLGVLLWTFVLYNGIFAISGKPADWLLPLIARIIGIDVEASSTELQEKETTVWYAAYKDGYYFEVPPLIEVNFL